MSILDKFKPSCSSAVRVLISLNTITLGIVHILGTSATSFATVDLVSPLIYGSALLVLGIALLVTSRRSLRLTIYGRVIAALVASLWTMLAVDTGLHNAWGASLKNVILAAYSLIEVNDHDNR